MAKKIDPKTSAEVEIKKIKEEVVSLRETVDKLVEKVFEANVKVEPGAPAIKKEKVGPQGKSNRKLFIFGGIILGLIVITTASLFVFFPARLVLEVAKIVKTEVSPTPTVVTEPVLVKSEWTFEVLNGSGIAGVAGKAADQLEALGYKVVIIDNADRQTYQGNGLFVSEDMESKVDLLVGDLKETIEIATVAGVLRDSTASARLIIGTQ
ncbi:MAG: LytR C-terminal domain-containing protein [Candidatus Levybacteria bacterium]|nr:LytR C-terminal domain-containing protein [Candidatus Levybacteria bacterium]